MYQLDMYQYRFHYILVCFHYNVDQLNRFRCWGRNLIDMIDRMLRINMKNSLSYRVNKHEMLSKGINQQHMLIHIYLADKNMGMNIHLIYLVLYIHQMNYQHILEDIKLNRQNLGMMFWLGIFFYIFYLKLNNIIRIGSLYWFSIFL